MNKCPAKLVNKKKVAQSINYATKYVITGNLKTVTAIFKKKMA